MYQPYSGEHTPCPEAVNKDTKWKPCFFVCVFCVLFWPFFFYPIDFGDDYLFLFLFFGFLFLKEKSMKLGRQGVGDNVGEAEG